jgi:hypothetical protein
VLDGFEVKLLQSRLSDNPQMYPTIVQALLKLVKARKSPGLSSLENLNGKPSWDDPDDTLPEAERGLSDETIKKMIAALNLM